MITEPSSPAPNPWKLRLGVLTLAHVVGTIHIASILAMAPIIKDELLLSATQIGLLMTVYNGTKGLSAIVTGRVADAMGVAWTLLACHLIMCGGGVVVALAQNYLQMLGGMFLLGMGYAFVNPATAKGVLMWFTPERRATAMGTKQTGVPVGYGIGSLGLAAAALVDWRLVMWVAVGVTVVNGASCLLLAEKKSEDTPLTRDRPKSSVFSLVRNRRVNAINAGSSLANAAQQSFFSFLSQFLHEGLRASLAASSAVLAAGHIAAAFGRIVTGVISDRWFRTNRTALLAAMSVVGLLAAVGMALLDADGSLTAVLVFPLTIVLGLTIVSFSGMSLTTVAESVEQHQAGSAVGYHMLLVSIGGTIGPPIFGYIVDSTGGYEGSWMFLAAALAASALIFVMVSRRPKPKSEG